MPVTTIADLLQLLTREAGRPRITWYGQGGERVELSGAVLENWVNKTANLLVEEFDAGPGTVVGLDLPAHWRTLVWALATWRVGACVSDRAAGSDVLVTDDPTRGPEHPALVVVPLPALARRVEGVLPPGAIDAGSAVMTYADQLLWAPTAVASAPALDTGGAVILHDGLVGALTEAVPTTPERVLLPAGDLASFLRAGVGTLLAGGSVVVLHGDVADELARDDARRARLLSTEQVTTELPHP